MTSSPVCTCAVCPVHAHQPRSAVDAGLDAWPQWTNPTLDHLASVVAWLDGAEAMAAGHGVLEAHLQVDSRETYRLLLQGHLEERARLEPRRPAVTGSDGVPRLRVENGHCRGLTSVFGPVTVTRKAYRATPISTPPEDAVPQVATPEGTTPEGTTARKTPRNLYPADAGLNLPAGLHSAGLARLAALEAPRGSYQDAREAIERVSGVRLGKRQVEDLTRHAACDVEAFYTARRPEPCPGRVLGLQCDGKGIVMRPGSLRPGTAKAAARVSAKLSTRLSPGEKHGRKRMAEIVTVYDLDPAPRTVEDIIPDPRTQTPPVPGVTPKRRPGPTVTGKWLAANVIDDLPAVIAGMFDEAERRDPGHERTWVALLDGNNQQIDAVTDQAAARGVSVTIIIDVVHVLEYIWGAAWTFYYPGEVEAQTWVADHARTILAGQALDAAQAIRQQADDGGFRGRERTGADEAVAYLTRKAPYLDYPTALTSGWQIATGIIEGAARYLIKDRMDITGARWTTPGAQAVLALRAVITNGDFEQYWQFHQQQELRRNHLDHYTKLDLDLAA